MEYPSRNIKWIVILLIFMIAVFFTVVIISGTKVYPKSYTQDPHPPYKGTLDRNTAQFLFQQDQFVSDFSEILKLDAAGQNVNQENDGGNLLEHVKLMKSRLNAMDSASVAAPFSDYKQETDTYFSGIISSLEALSEKGDSGADQMQELYYGLVDFVNRKTDDLPALFDKLGVEYTIEVDENGRKTVNYSYTDTIPNMG